MKELRLGIVLCMVALLCSCGSQPNVPVAEPPPAPPCADPTCPLKPLAQPFAIMEAAANDARSTVAVVTPERELRVFHRGAWRSWPMRETVARARCGFEPDPLLGYVQVGLSANGDEAWFLGREGSKTAPLFTLSASCLVDVRSGTVRHLGEALGHPDELDDTAIEERGFPRIVLEKTMAALWKASGGISLVRRAERRVEKLPLEGPVGECVVTMDDKELVAVCAPDRESGQVRIHRFDLTQTPATLTATKELETELDHLELVLSPGGKLVAAFENPIAPHTTASLVIIELASARMTLQTRMPAISTVELSPATSTMLVVVEAGLQRGSLEGALLESHDVDWHPQRLFLTTKGDELLCAGYSELSHYEVQWTVRSATATRSLPPKALGPDQAPVGLLSRGTLEDAPVAPQRGDLFSSGVALLRRTGLRCRSDACGFDIFVPFSCGGSLTHSAAWLGGRTLPRRLLSTRRVPYSWAAGQARQTSRLRSDS